MDVSAQLKTALSDRYLIEREIGAGGMATVYLARDLKHNRRVALKVLRPELGALLGPERFLSEINVTANLQHPHLLPLFDSGEANGLLFYVMPYVEGESLRDRLTRERQLPVDEALKIAVAVAGALDYAHRQGVIHRDLKPENILLHDGQPLVTDFGIALAITNAGGARVTQTGISLGTPQYMSPEQATGDRVIDARTDIYSLAAMLHEMLTGEPPHVGTTVQAIIAKVLTERPQPARHLRETVPVHVDAAIMQALAKLPADRFASAAEFADALMGVRAIALPAQLTLATYEVVPTGAALRRKRITMAAPWVLLVGVVLAWAAAIGRDEAQPGLSSMLMPLMLPDSIHPSTPGGVTISLSPDGSQLAFVAGQRPRQAIYVRPMLALDSRLVRGTEGGNNPRFSPDGEWLFFSGQGGIKKVPVSGGTAVAVTDSAAGLMGNATWNGPSELLTGYGELLRISTENGTRTVLAAVDRIQGHLRYSWPHVLPGGKYALITLWKNTLQTRNTLQTAGQELGLVRLRDGRVTELGVPGTNPRYIAGGIVVFGRYNVQAVLAAPFSLRDLLFTGPPVLVLENVYIRTGGAVELTVSETGAAVFKRRQSPQLQLVRVHRNGVATPLTTDSGRIDYPRVGPGGRRIVLQDGFGANIDVWNYDLVSGARVRVTTDGSSAGPEWSPDGRRIFFNDVRDIWSKSSDGTGNAELHADSARGITFGRSFIAVRRGDDIWIAPADSPKALRPFVHSAAQETSQRMSPDGRAIAYVSDEAGRREVYVQPVPGPGDRVPVSTGGGVEPMWSPSGSELFYRTLSDLPGHFMSAKIVRHPQLEVARLDTLFPDPYWRGFASEASRSNYDVFPSGNEFVFLRTVTTERYELFAIANWTDDVRKRLAAAQRAR